jgi:hypothetical protein
MLEQSYLSQGGLVDFHRHLTETLSPQVINDLDENPADYLFSYIQRSAQRAARYCAESNHIYAGSRSTSFHDTGVWEYNRINRCAILVSLKSLQRFLSFPEVDTGARQLRLRSLLPEYQALLEEIEIIGADIQGMLQNQAHNASMEEAKRGVAQADSVRRYEPCLLKFKLTDTC